MSAWGETRVKNLVHELAEYPANCVLKQRLLLRIGMKSLTNFFFSWKSIQSFEN